MFDGLTWNEFGGYYEGNAWAARGDEIERRQLASQLGIDPKEVR